MPLWFYHKVQEVSPERDAPGSDRTPSGQVRRHTAKFTNLVNLRVLLAFRDKAVYGRVGDAPLFA